MQDKFKRSYINCTTYQVRYTPPTEGSIVHNETNAHTCT